MDISVIVTVVFDSYQSLASGYHCDQVFSRDMINIKRLCLDLCHRTGMQSVFV